jgi:hypothetical protein
MAATEMLNLISSEYNETIINLGGNINQDFKVYHNAFKTKNKKHIIFQKESDFKPFNKNDYESLDIPERLKIAYSKIGKFSFYRNKNPAYSYQYLVITNELYKKFNKDITANMDIKIKEFVFGNYLIE